MLWGISAVCHSTDNYQPVAISCARVACDVHLPALQSELAQLLKHPWIDHVNRNDYQGRWDVLPLRCQGVHAHAHPIMQGFAIAVGDEWQDLPVLVTCPAMNVFLQSFIYRAAVPPLFPVALLN